MVVTFAENNHAVFPENEGIACLTLGQSLNVCILITEQVAEEHISLTSNKHLAALKHKMIARLLR
jgi:hypothetical protein